MKQKTSGVQIIRKTELEKATPMQAFLTSFIILVLIFAPIAVVGILLTGSYESFGTGDFYGVYIGIGFGVLLAFILSFIFMKLATK
jgi:hypothetical protein